MSVVEALERDLEGIRRRAPDVADSTLAAAALSLARELDDATNSATSKSMCAKALNETLATMHKLMPEKHEADKLDELSSRRAARIAGGSAP